MPDWDSTARPPREKLVRINEGFVLDVSLLTRAKMIDVMDDWCGARPGKFEGIHAPGNREKGNPSITSSITTTLECFGIRQMKSVCGNL